MHQLITAVGTPHPPKKAFFLPEFCPSSKKKVVHCFSKKKKGRALLSKHLILPHWLPVCPWRRFAAARAGRLHLALRDRATVKVFTRPQTKKWTILHTHKKCKICFSGPHQLRAGGGGRGIRGSFRRGKFVGGKFRHPWKSQSSNCSNSRTPERANPCSVPLNVTKGQGNLHNVVFLRSGLRNAAKKAADIDCFALAFR